MSIYFVPVAMIFCHIFDDYYLQGILAKLKQKSYWKENVPQELYKNDYIMALVMHAFSWAFMIMLPIAMYQNFNVTFGFVIVLIINTIIHSVVDDLKANAHKINLIIDQTIHIFQIIITFSIWQIAGNL